MMATWLLPDGWKWIRLDEVCDIYGGSTPSRARSDFFGGAVVWVTPSDLQTGGLVEIVSDSASRLTQAGLESCSARLLPVGTVLFSSRATIGKIAIAGVPLATNQGFANFVCGPRVHNYYLSWCLRALTEDIKGLANSTTYLEVSRGRLHSYSIPVPYPEDQTRSLAEQRRIVAHIEALFAELGECRKLHRAVVEDTNRLMDAVVAEAFDPVILQSWPFEDELSSLVEIIAPLVDPTQAEYRDLPHINGEVIEQGSGQLLPYRTAAEDKMRSSKYLFKPDSVLYSKIRPRLRKVITVDFVGLCSADMYPLERKTDDLSNDFLKWALLSPHFTDYAVAESGRARMPKINRSQLFAYRLRYPNRDQQDRISGLLAAAKVEIVEMKKTESEDSTLLGMLEQAILAQAFRGES